MGDIRLRGLERKRTQKLHTNTRAKEEYGEMGAVI